MCRWVCVDLPSYAMNLDAPPVCMPSCRCLANVSKVLACHKPVYDSRRYRVQEI